MGPAALHRKYTSNLASHQTRRKYKPQQKKFPLLRTPPYWGNCVSKLHLQASLWLHYSPEFLVSIRGAQEMHSERVRVEECARLRAIALLLPLPICSISPSARSGSVFIPIANSPYSFCAFPLCASTTGCCVLLDCRCLNIMLKSINKPIYQWQITD